MRRTVLLLLCLLAAPASAQDRDVASLLRGLAPELTGLAVPDASAFVAGDRIIAVGDSVAGPLAVIGTVRVEGMVTGDVFVIDGDLILAADGQVTGDAVAINGAVRIERGFVQGDRRSIDGALTAPPPASPGAVLRERVAVTLGWAAVVLLIGIGVLVFGGKTLDTVGLVLDEQFGRSFVVGLLATLGAAPALILACIGLALTIIGILLIPFLVVASVLAAAGLLALGFLAAARVAGQSMLSRRSRTGANDRSTAVRTLVVGIVFFIGLWLTVALLTPFPAAATAFRLAAFGITWAAMTVGLGATLLSRGGTQIPWSARGAPPTTPAAGLTPAPVAASWQTPTPISGVAAVRRPPTTASRGGS